MSKQTIEEILAPKPELRPCFFALLGCTTFALGSYLLVSILKEVSGINQEMAELGEQLSSIEEMIHDQIGTGATEDPDDDDPDGKPLKVVR